MATPHNYPLTFYAGDSESFKIALKNPDGSDVVGLEDATAKMDIKLNLKNPPTLSKTSSLDPLTNSFAFYFTPEETQMLMGDNPFAKITYKYDIQITKETSVKTVIKGTLVVTEDVTRP